MKKKLPLARKEVDDVLGGDEAWRNVDKTEGECFVTFVMRVENGPVSISAVCISTDRNWQRVCQSKGTISQMFSFPDPRSRLSLTGQEKTMLITCGLKEGRCGLGWFISVDHRCPSYYGQP